MPKLLVIRFDVSFTACVPAFSRISVSLSPFPIPHPRPSKRAKPFRIGRFVADFNTIRRFRTNCPVSPSVSSSRSPYSVIGESIGVPARYSSRSFLFFSFSPPKRNRSRSANPRSASLSLRLVLLEVTRTSILCFFFGPPFVLFARTTTSERRREPRRWQSAAVRSGTTSANAYTRSKYIERCEFGGSRWRASERAKICRETAERRRLFIG